MKKNVAVLFISGQSNAHAHGQTLKESEYIASPLENVFSLDRNPNQTFDLSNVEWSGFTTHGKNLGESQDNTGSFAYHFAKSWQNAIERGDNYIAGLSMGGYGALKIGLKNCDTFCAAVGLSSVADIVGAAHMFENALIPVFGKELQIPDEEDLFKLAEHCNDNPLKPRIYMGVGTEDFLYEGNCKLKEKFQSLNYEYTYQESKGIHSWDFWDEYIQNVLKWMFA